MVVREGAREGKREGTKDRGEGRRDRDKGKMKVGGGERWRMGGLEGLKRLSRGGEGGGWERV